MGRGYQHQLMGSNRKMRQNFMNPNDNQYPGNNNNGGGNQGGGQRPGNSAFGFPSNPQVIPQNQLSNKDKDNEGDDDKTLSLNPLSP